jgi:radical SAM protein with 4Fe4S-binding SPASM domain
LNNDTDIEYEENFCCPQLWERLVITSNGRVVLCSNDEMGSYEVGDASNESIHSIWHGEKFTKARESHIKHKGVEEVSPCKSCYLPRKTIQESTEFDNRLINIDNYLNREQKVGK